MPAPRTEPPPITSQPQPPDQVDYRSNPNVGQHATQEQGRHARGVPNERGAFQPPQPNIGERGYSLNSLDAPPNRMIPDTASPGALPQGHTPDDPNTLGAWDFWGA